MPVSNISTTWEDNKRLTISLPLVYTLWSNLNVITSPSKCLNDL